MNRRRTTILLVVFATLGLACVDLSAPKGAASISPLQPPAAFVVHGDVMRDSAGAPAKPGLTAFAGDGSVMPDAQPEFFITDSAAPAHFNAAGVLVGDRLGVFHVIGQIGNLQTPPFLIAVTVAPTTIARAPATPGSDTIRAPLGKDSTQSVGTTSISVIVTGAGDTAVQNVLVHLKLTRTLASSSQTQPAVYIGDNESKKPISGDTTNSSGMTGRATLFVLTRNLADQALVSGQKVDSAVVEASATYKGLPLIGSPLVIVIPIRVTISIQ